MKKPSFIIFITLLISILLLVPSGHCQGGRLPDGRAYRTDKEGNQLVDYIAELELEVESLKRQVTGLEDENAEKRALVEKFQSGKVVDQNVTERNLAANEPRVKEAVKPQEECKPQIVEKVVEKIVEKPVERVVEKRVNCEGEKNQAYLNEITNLKDELSQTQIALAKKSEELDQKSIDYDILVSNQNKITLGTSRVASNQSPAGSNNRIKTFGGDTRYRAVDMLRKSMQQDLRSLDDLINYRAKLYARLEAGKFPRPDKIETSEFRKKLDTADQVHDLARVRTEINELRGKVQQDIALYKRDLKIL